MAKLQLKFMDGFFVAVMLLCALSWFSKYSFMLGMATVLLVLFSMWD